MNLLLKLISAILITLTIISCKEEKKITELKQGFWHAEIHMQNQKLPFNFEIINENGNYKANLINGKETFSLDEVNIVDDSIFFKLHIFDIDLRAKIIGDSLNGLYIKNYINNYRIPFTAKHGKSTRFTNPKSSNLFDGKWQVTFIKNDSTSYPAIGVFKKEGNTLTGTFLTETGDYRYLEGFTTDNKMSLFTFDGNHAFIFNASIENDSLKGTFHSGKNYIENFTAFKNENAELTDANELTYLKKGYDKIEFSFPGLDGKSISLNDEKYKNKVVLVQIFGTWCPNCMDETKFYTNWYKKNKDKGVEIIGLAFEAKDDFEYAKTRVEKMKQKFNIDYDYAIAGVFNKQAAANSFPMLNHVLSFPTTIFIDKKGEIRRIHTGFSGPATGAYYENYVEDFNSFMNQLINE